MWQKKISIVVILIVILLLTLVGAGLAAPQFKLYYKVQPGDALVNIAREFGTSVAKLKETNNLEDRFIKAGEEIIIPQKKEAVDKEKKRKKYDRNLLSDLYDEDIFANYELTDNNDEVIIKISKDSTQTVDISNLRTLDYYIKSGDTLYELSQEFNTSVAVLKKLNGLDDTDVIRVGDKITLPINSLTPKQVISKTISQQELNLLARLISGEARGEPFVGQVAVGAVVLNRVVSNSFPDTIEGVIYQSRQFTAVSDGQINIRPNWEAKEAARAVLSGQDPSRGALYFYNPKTAKTMWWLSTRSTLVKIGDHLFAK
jgi:N-acetylmuramoyl-L-alanine amidase